jgi:DNA-binding CsgD family transcriptional regulator
MLHRSPIDQAWAPLRTADGGFSSPTKRPDTTQPNEVLTMCPANGGAHGVAPREIVQIELSGRRCRLLLIDDKAAAPANTRQSAPNAKVFGENELTRFDFLGIRYAIVADPVRPREASDVLGDTFAPSTDIRNLLTGRELQIVQLVCIGCLTKQIADRLRISEFTVRSYLKTIYCKLGVRSRAAMVFCYMKAMQRADDGDDQ